MLTRTELIELERSLRDKRVLSVYIDGTAKDFAVGQRKWRIDLDHSLKDLRAWLTDSSHSEREEFEDCVRLLEQRLPTSAPTIGAPGWAAFITGGSVRYAESLPVAMPTVAVWSTGASIAPYVRALKEARPVVVVVVDKRKAVLFRYEQGKLDQRKTIHTYAVSSQHVHMGSPPRQGFHAGVRGTAGRDEDQRVMTSATNRMLHDVVSEALVLAGDEGFILTGGVPRTSGELAQMIEGSAPGRVHNLESLDVHSSDAEVAEAARRGASHLRDATDLKNIEEVIEEAGERGLGALGPAETREALGQSRVRDLFLTNSFIEDHAADAEDAVRTALSQGAVVEEVSRDAARRLNELGGVAARLRYRL